MLCVAQSAAWRIVQQNWLRPTKTAIGHLPLHQMNELQFNFRLKFVCCCVAQVQKTIQAKIVLRSNLLKVTCACQNKWSCGLTSTQKTDSTFFLAWSYLCCKIPNSCQSICFVSCLVSQETMQKLSKSRRRGTGNIPVGHDLIDLT